MPEDVTAISLNCGGHHSLLAIYTHTGTRDYMTAKENTLSLRSLRMRIFFSSPIFSLWALRPSTSCMFTHIARYRKLMASTNMLVSHVEHKRQLKEIDELWSRRLVRRNQEAKKQLKEEQKKREKQLQEIQEKKDKRIQEMREEKENLRDKVSSGDRERMMLAHNFNVRGALVFQARLYKIIDSESGTQTGLNELAQKTELQKILEQEVQERRLVYSNVDRCFPHLYHCVSKHARGNDGIIIIIREQDFSPNERAALIVLLKLQQDWTYPLEWKEVSVEEEEVEDGKK
ncbi:hypothetical protein HOY82DRAFT_537017 [Tuber indicum]|nr:hypothetical protein HOY82DRAFT_537017 [Tuber indicum]